MIVFLHGGGWVLGSVEVTDAACRALANASGCVVVSVEYRRAPEHPFPAGPSDAYTAAFWCAKNGPQAGGDGGPIAVCGASAGGNIAATVTPWARDRGGPPVGFQGLVCPVTDLTRALPPIGPTASATASTARTSPGSSTTTSPPASTCDSLICHPCTRPISEDFRRRTCRPPSTTLCATRERHTPNASARAGVPVTCTRYAGQIHGFFSSLDLYDASAEAIAELGGAVRGVLG